jgi:hypothetical protein
LKAHKRDIVGSRDECRTWRRLVASCNFRSRLAIQLQKQIIAQLLCPSRRGLAQLMAIGLWLGLHGLSLGHRPIQLYEVSHRRLQSPGPGLIGQLTTIASPYNRSLELRRMLSTTGGSGAAAAA